MLQTSPSVCVRFVGNAEIVMQHYLVWRKVLQLPKFMRRRESVVCQTYNFGSRSQRKLQSDFLKILLCHLNRFLRFKEEILFMKIIFQTLKCCTIHNFVVLYRKVIIPCIVCFFNSRHKKAYKHSYVLYTSPVKCMTNLSIVFLSKRALRFS